MQARNRLIVAADLSTRDEILRLADDVAGAAGVLKIGLHAFVATGPSVVTELVARGHSVFLDLKIHDIPNTASHAVAEAGRLGAAMLTVHAAGGRGMLRAAAEKAVGNLLILGVTVLTSLEAEDVHAIGMTGSPLENVLRLAALTHESGCGGVVASPLEIMAIRARFGDTLKIVAPGIRPAGSPSDDQRRTLTPREAIAAGADYIVVGRPITAAKDRRAAALRIAEEIDRA